jgi:hypothetical protein
MKIQKCNVVAQATPVLTYKQMCNKEGVYRQAGVKVGARFIVLKANNDTVVLYYNDDLLQPAATTWSSASFMYEEVPVATVCLEIKEP